MLLGVAILLLVALCFLFDVHAVAKAWAEPIPTLLRGDDFPSPPRQRERDTKGESDYKWRAGTVERTNASTKSEDRGSEEDQVQGTL
jgi:hypothetical protein